MDWPLGGIDSVRRRPGMYVGDPRDGTGLHNLVYEVVGNAINEVVAGHAKNILVRLNEDGSCTVTDDGRGMSVDRHPRLLEISIPEAALLLLHSGPNYEEHGPYQGIGLCPVNALSEWFELRIWRYGLEHHLRLVDGMPATPLQVAGSSEGRHGTTLTFKPSPSYFFDTSFDAARLRRRLDEFATDYNVAIEFADCR